MTETELEYQFCFNCNDRKNCYTKPKDCTRIKEEIGLQDMTNEEWLKQANTEQLAEWIFQIFGEGVAFGETHGQTKLFPNDDIIHEGLVVEWLKQPHQKE